MSDKPYTFDESPEETSQSTLRSDAIYGGVGEEEQHNAVTGYGKPNNDHERDAVTKPQYKTKVKTQIQSSLVLKKRCKNFQKVSSKTKRKIPSKLLLDPKKQQKEN